MNKKLFPAISALFAAIICAGCFVKIPVGPLVPIVIQNGLSILTGVLIGGMFAGTPVALFLIAGLIGLPVYSGGTFGLQIWLGPTGGFYPGYLLGAVVAGFIAGRPSIKEKKPSAKEIIRVSAAMLAGMIILYIPGTIHYSRYVLADNSVPADKSVIAYTMSSCVLPCIPGDIIKTIVAIPVALTIRPVLAQYLYSSKTEKKTTIIVNSDDAE